MLALSRIANNLFGEEKSMDCWPFNFIFKYVPFFKYCTEQNTKRIISLKRCYLLMKPRGSIIKWYVSTMFPKQLNTSNNSFPLKTTTKVSCPAR